MNSALQENHIRLLQLAERLGGNATDVIVCAKYYRGGHPLKSQALSDEAEALNQLREAAEYMKTAATLISGAVRTLQSLSPNLGLTPHAFFGVAGSVNGAQPGDRCDACGRTREQHPKDPR